MPKIVSANRLKDGIVVYLGGDGSWPDRLAEARVFHDDEAQEGLAKARDDARRNLVVEPFLVEIETGADGMRPSSLRNAIRAQGPTIDYVPKARPEPARTDRS